MNSLKYFTTDGIRGKVGETPITPDFLLKLGWAIGVVLGKNKVKKFIIGRDTRSSGFMLQSALESGILSAGISTLLTGCIPTPAVAYLTQSLNASVGIVVSGSHNLYDYNGIKIFYNNGIKITKALELSIEETIRYPYFHPFSIKFGHSNVILDGENKYLTFCKNTFPKNLNLSKLTIVLDCANGATYKIAPKIFKDLGAKIITCSVLPNGCNINEKSGSTDLLQLKKLVILEKADIGLAFDGDGDRVIMVDHLGNAVDGDQIIYIIAKAYFNNNELNGGVVGTLMTNMGIVIAFKKLGIPFSAAKVGDRYICEKMKEKNWILGAEKSGHIILLDKHSTGDGIIASLKILSIMINNRMTLYDLSNQVKLFPQILLNVFLKNDKYFEKKDKIKTILSKYTRILGEKGRILLRKSGTEPCIRIMVEGQDYPKIYKLAHSIANIINTV